MASLVSVTLADHLLREGFPDNLQSNPLVHLPCVVTGYLSNLLYCLVRTI